MPFTGRRLINLMVMTVVAVTSLISGCAEQPVGYIFTPSHRHKTSTARVVATVISTIYDHTDTAVKYLDRSSLTDDYGSLLPGGWENIIAVDTTTGEPYTLYIHNYLDQKYHFLRFDPVPMNQAVRSPSSLDYTYIEIRSYQNLRTSAFYGNISKVNQLKIEYADNRTDPFNVDGWFEIRTVLPVEIDIETALGSFTITDYVAVNWQLFIENYSIDQDDQTSRLVLAGVVPLYDEELQPHFTQISGDIEINSRGRGGGDMWLWGEPVAKLHFTGRTHKFDGYFTLYEEDHYGRYSFD